MDFYISIMYYVNNSTKSRRMWIGLIVRGERRRLACGLSPAV